MAWLRLIRWPNLLIIALTQFVAWWCVIRPLPEHVRQPLAVLDASNFFLLCSSTVLIAAAGYIINDYFDIRIDVINKPDEVILEKTIPRRMAIIVHSLLNLAGFFLAAIVAWHAHHIEWTILQLLCTAMLWRYSTTWKRQFIIGNLVVATLTAFTIAALLLYEPTVYAEWVETSLVGPPPEPEWVLYIFMFFAFMLTWMREIVKDMEDYKGDDAEGCVTMPIQWGLLRSSRFVQLLGAGVILVLAFTVFFLVLFGNYISVLFIGLTIIIPLIKWLLSLPKVATSEHYHNASKQIKWIMVAGVVTLWIVYIDNHLYDWLFPAKFPEV